MAQKKAKKFVPPNFESHQTDDLDDQDITKNQYDGGDNEQYVINEDELHLRRQETMDAGMRAQGKSGRVVFGKMRNAKIEEQGTVEVNGRLAPTDVWDKLKKGEDATIEEIWDPIDETTAPLPRHRLPTKFERYSEHPEAEHDIERLNDPAYLRTQIDTLSGLLQDCHLELKSQEELAISHDWNASRALKKSQRLESFTQFVIHEVAKPLVLNEARSNHKASKRKATLNERERDMKLERLALNKAQEELHELQDNVTKSATETKMVLKSLREKLLDDDAKTAAPREDVLAEQDSEMQQEAAEHTKLLQEERAEISKQKRDM
jgi:hypothetical protein